MSNNSQFLIEQTFNEDIYVVQNIRHLDQRGKLVKTFSEELFSQIGLSLQFVESYFATSSAGVLRGMHYQKEPNQHTKLVSVVEGSILDVVVGVDPRNLGKVFSVELSAENNRSIVVPGGYAHGYCVLSSTAIVVAQMSSEYCSKSEFGVRYDSFGFRWPIDNPIISEKDSGQPILDDLF